MGLPSILLMEENPLAYKSEVKNTSHFQHCIAVTLSPVAPPGSEWLNAWKRCAPGTSMGRSKLALVGLWPEIA